MYILVFKLLEALAMGLCIAFALVVAGAIAYIAAATRSAGREDADLGISDICSDAANARHGTHIKEESK